MKKHILPISIILLSIGLWLFNFGELPKEIPTHWGVNGEINDYSSKLTAFLELHVVMFFLYLLLNITPKIDPRKNNYKYFSKSYYQVTISLLILFFFINTSILFYGLGYNFPIGKLVFLFIGFIFMVLGNYLSQIRSNFFIGIRTPWTLSNENVWKKTHRFSGKLFFFAGLCMVLLYFFPISLGKYIIIPLIVIIVILPILYSYIQFRKELK